MYSIWHKHANDSYRLYKRKWKRKERRDSIDLLPETDVVNTSDITSSVIRVRFGFSFLKIFFEFFITNFETSNCIIIVRNGTVTFLLLGRQFVCHVA
jgi:hypothetical protein